MEFISQFLPTKAYRHIFPIKGILEEKEVIITTYEQEMEKKNKIDQNNRSSLNRGMNKAEKSFASGQ